MVMITETQIEELLNELPFCGHANILWDNSQTNISFSGILIAEAAERLTHAS